MVGDKVTLDFTNVKDAAKFTKKHYEAGDYKARVKSYEVTMPKDKSDKTKMWLFTLELVDKRNATYPYYCKLQENQLWKIRNLFAAAGITIPKKRVALDPSRVVGKLIGVTLEDEEYEGKMQSVIDAVIPASEVGGSVAAEDDEDEETEDEEEAEEADTEDDDDEDEDEDQDAYDAMDRAELKEYIAGAELDIRVKRSMSDDDLRVAIRAAEADTDEEEDEEDDEEPAPAPKASKKTSKKKAAVTDDELEELEIDDL